MFTFDGVENFNQVGASMSKLHTNSKLIHLEKNFSRETGAITPPIFLTSTFASGNEEGFDYTRSGNPNFRNLAESVALLEGAKYATVFGSGVAAMTAVMSTAKSGMKIAAEQNLYGCTIRLFDQVFRNFGVHSCYLDFSSPGVFAALDEIRPDIVWLESPTNPCLKVIDLAAVGSYCRDHNIVLVVDNTFASSALQKPLELGATLSLQSLTKYANGHCDALAGAVATNSQEWFERLEFAQKALGLQPSPMDCWLVSRGLKTYPLRIKAQSESALHLARSLEEDAAFAGVYYPLLESNPDYQLARRQMKAGSGVVSVQLQGDHNETVEFLRNLQLFTVAESLGGFESLVCHPFSMTHASVPTELKLGAGITKNLVRFSVGLEEVEDLLADIKQAIPKSVRDRVHKGRSTSSTCSKEVTSPSESYVFECL